MKKYYISYWRDFGNTYDLMWTDSPEMEKQLPANAERISRKEAIEKCLEELTARKNDPAFSGYASAAVYPAGYDGDIVNDRRYTLVNHIWERN